MTRVVILTSSRFGSASNCLPALVDHPGVEVAMVVHCLAQFVSRRRKLLRDLRKIRRIGIGGTAVGLAIRPWFVGQPTEDLESLCRRLEVPFEVSPRTNADETVELFRRSGADLGLSLANGMIFPKVFRVPPLGMLNVHGEVLPAFQGAQSVIWPIHEGIGETGFTIHEVDRNIDTGRIYYQERFPIEFQPTLRETVAWGLAEIQRRVPPALARVVADVEEYRARATVQTGGRSFTTPTLRQFLQMRSQFRRLRDAAC